MCFLPQLKKKSPGWGREWQPSRGPQGLTLCHRPPPHSPSFSPLGKKLGFTIDNGKLHNVSLGQGQEVVAENALDVAAESGHWVILQVGRPPSPPRLRPREPATGLGLGDSGAPTPSSAPSRSAGWHGASGASGASGPPGGSAGSSEARKTPGWMPGEPLRRYHLKHRSISAKSTPSRCLAGGGGALATFRANPSTAPSWVLQPPSAHPPPGLSHKHLQVTQLPQAPRCGRPQSAGVTWPGVESSASRHFFLS